MPPSRSSTPTTTLPLVSPRSLPTPPSLAPLLTKPSFHSSLAILRATHALLVLAQPLLMPHALPSSTLTTHLLRTHSSMPSEMLSYLPTLMARMTMSTHYLTPSLLALMLHAAPAKRSHRLRPHWVLTLLMKLFPPRKVRLLLRMSRNRRL
jgi:hypothetical protein